MTEDSRYAPLDRPEILATLFHPRREEERAQAPEGALDYDIEVADGVSIGARFFLAPPEAAHILFFHGNGEIVSDYDTVGPLFVEQGLSLLSVDYRGYGRSDGTPSATHMMQDAHTVFKDVQGWIKDNERTGPLVVMGRSLGSAGAIDLAASYGDDIAGLIIESGFSRTIPLLQSLGVDTERLGISEESGFGNLEKIEQVSKPTLIIHGRYDQIIPIQDAEWLQVYCGARGKQFHMIPGADHNTVMSQAGPVYFELIKAFTNKIQGIREYQFFRREGGKRTQTSGTSDS